MKSHTFAMKELQGIGLGASLKCVHREKERETLVHMKAYKTLVFHVII